jgi:hypothetical protein
VPSKKKKKKSQQLKKKVQNFQSLKLRKFVTK